MSNEPKRPYYVPPKPKPAPVPSLIVALGDAIGAWGSGKKSKNNSSKKG